MDLTFYLVGFSFRCITVGTVWKSKELHEDNVAVSATN